MRRQIRLCRSEDEARAARVAAALLVAVCLGIAACGGVVEGQAAGSEAPAVVTDRSRAVAETNDFLRLIFLSFTPPTLGAPGAHRVFVGASAFYEPALPLKDVLGYSGVPYNPAVNLIALRCMPPDPGKIEPTLATWPNVLDIVASDTDENESSCPAEPDQQCSAPGDAERAVSCLAREYVRLFGDLTSPFAALTLEPALRYGALALSCCSESTTRTCGDVLRTRYGIYPSFSGLGLTVKDTGSSPALSAAEVLRRAITPEYLVRNVTLADAGCSCISVPPYDGREDAPLDMGFIIERGGVDGECATVPRLAYAQR